MFVPLNAGEFDHLECLCLLLDMMKIDPIYSSVTHRYVESPVGGGGGGGGVEVNLAIVVYFARLK